MCLTESNAYFNKVYIPAQKGRREKMVVSSREPRPPQQTPDILLIIKKVFHNYFDLTWEQITSKTRKREIVQVRQLAMWFMIAHTKWSLEVIGKRCGNKDHATVLHARKTVNNLRETDKFYRVIFDQVNEEIENEIWKPKLSKVA